MSNLMEIVFVLDRSGSMAGSESDVIGGFNRLIQDQLEHEQKALVTTVLFNTSMRHLHDRVPLEQVERLTAADYCPCGGTALLDALGETIKRIKIAHRYARKEDVPAKTLVVVMTDGEENSSRHYTNRKIQELVKRQEEKYHWEFMFIGADIDAFASARDIGIQVSRTVPLSKDEDSFDDCFSAVSEYACRVSSTRARRVSDAEFDDIFSVFRKKK
jgi:uncharacterized protein YegL